MNFLIIKEIKNRKLLDIIINGPAAILVILNKTIPKKHDKAPIIRDIKEYWNKFLLKFLLVQAGMATSAAVINPPTILTPNATIRAMQLK